MYFWAPHSSRIAHKHASATQQGTDALIPAHPNPFAAAVQLKTLHLEASYKSHVAPLTAIHGLIFNALILLLNLGY